MRSPVLLIALAAGAAASHADRDTTPVALAWRHAAGLRAGHVYANMRTGERVVSLDAAVGTRTGVLGSFPWTTTVPDPCQGAAGIDPGDQRLAVFTDIMSEADGDAGRANAVRLWHDWFDVEPDTTMSGMAFQFYTGLQDPGFTPGQDSSFDDPVGIPGYDMIMVFTENDDPTNQLDAVAHSPILVAELPGANDEDGNGVIEFGEGRLWTFYLDFSDTPIDLADSDGSTSNPQGGDLDGPGTVGHGFADCGYVIAFRQPGVAEGDLMFRENAAIDFSHVDLDPVVGIGNPEGQEPDPSTFANILPTGTGLYAPSDRLGTFAANAGSFTEWPVDPSVEREFGEGLGAWDAVEFYDAYGVDETGDGTRFNFGGFACRTPGGGADGALNPFAAFNMQFEFNTGPPRPRPCCVPDFALPYCVLDLADITGFLQAFHWQDFRADLTFDGVFDLEDLLLFVELFLGGDCTL